MKMGSDASFDVSPPSRNVELGFDTPVARHVLCLNRLAADSSRLDLTVRAESTSSVDVPYLLPQARRAHEGRKPHGGVGMDVQTLRRSVWVAAELVHHLRPTCVQGISAVHGYLRPESTLPLL